jgi:oligoribonuclease NrnB/cAMP/cGMP phosphodiesterase (DHH superfamily)
MKNVKILVIYHKSDLDGIMSAAVIYEYFNNSLVFGSHYLELMENIEFLGYEYGDDLPLQKIKDANNIIVADIMLPVFIMKDYDYKILWFDHHISNIKVSESNDFANIKGIRNTNMAACELIWGFYFKNDAPYIVRMLSLYDNNNYSPLIFEEVMTIQYGARLYIHDYKSAFGVLNDDVFDERIKTAGRPIFNYYKQQANEVYKNAIIGTFEDVNGKFHYIPIVNSTRLNVTNFNVDITPYDMNAAMWIDTTGIHFSIYATKNENMNALDIATKYGGGGHRYAAGFNCGFDTLKQILNI